MSVDFACKNIKIENIIKCSFNLSKADMELFKFFLRNENKAFSSNELKKELEFELSTIQKGLKRMYDSQILNKTQKNLEKGGYIFEYNIKSKTEIKKIILEIVNIWVEEVGNKFCDW